MLINVFGHWINADKIYTLYYNEPWLPEEGEKYNQYKHHKGYTTIFMSSSDYQSWVNIRIPEKTCDQVAQEINKQLKERG